MYTYSSHHPIPSFSHNFTHTLIGSSDGKEPAYHAGNPASIPWLGRSPGEKNGNPLQYACLENPMERGPGRQQSIRSQRVRHNCTT